MGGEFQGTESAVFFTSRFVAVEVDEIAAVVVEVVVVEEEIVVLRRGLVPSPRWAPNCWCKSGPKGTPIQQYSTRRQTVGVNRDRRVHRYKSIPLDRREGTRPLRRTTLSSSTTATSTTTAAISSTSTATTREVKKTAELSTLELSSHSILVPSITMTLLYIWMGVDGDFPQAPSGYFLPSPWWTRYLQKAPRAHTKAH
jgi:hypothetical protein